MGFYTYRFLEVNTFRFNKNYPQLITDKNRKDYYNKNSLPIHFLKLETIEKNIVNKAKDLGLNPNKVEEILSQMKTKKFNASKRKTNDFYLNEECIKLIQNKDALIFELFDYEK